MKINLNGVTETLLIPFYARVYGSKFYKDKFYDKTALENFEKIEYDFSKFKNGKMSIWGCISRSIILDRESKKFIEKYPNSKCISIGCGFDTRFDRVDNGRIIWYGLDFPEVISLRNKIFSNKSREYYIESDALNEEWAKEIKDDKEVLIILEGILMYFSEEKVKDFFIILKKYFPKAIILAEFSRPFFIKHQKFHDTISKTDAIAQWGISKSKNIEKIYPEIKFIEEWNLTKEMKSFSPFFISMFYLFIYKINNTIVKLSFK
ncbi:class I SAM-dependent methyltransferase [Fusobacterium gastrosuis]|uniref:class I SAM-dependent methyltransferase n=1 Tax=Fusobacterium gastrosuis TaxID=1755100 RepID=UPI00297151FB|nr:class I SAM-dependent methyltransferase [Fusobacteriaceae bacterium]MDY5714051.1 class I SAM-dependent methyltransferase [Fusobacterium gastrosuis]